MADGEYEHFKAMVMCCLRVSPEASNNEILLNLSEVSYKADITDDYIRRLTDAKIQCDINQRKIDELTTYIVDMHDKYNTVSKLMAESKKGEK
jgi:hypothetical protein